LSIPAVPVEAAALPAPVVSAKPAARPAGKRVAKAARRFEAPETVEEGGEAALPAGPEIAGTLQEDPPAVIGRPSVPPQKRGFLRGVVRRMNIFRKD
jgi:hypothetical protein